MVFTLERVGLKVGAATIASSSPRKHQDMRVVAEYALRDIEKPLAVSTYVTQLIASLPEKLAHELDPPDEPPAGKKPKRK